MTSPTTHKVSELKETENKNMSKLNFSPIQLEDKSWIDPIFKREQSQSSGACFANIFIWSPAFHQQVAKVEDGLAIKLAYQGSPLYSFPAGVSDLTSAILAMRADATTYGVPFSMLGITEKTRERLELAFPDHFVFLPDASLSDYIYEVEKLAQLPGKKLSSKRNHINRFVENHPDYQFEIIGAHNLQECIEMSREWMRLRQQSSSFSDEWDALRLAFAHFETLGFEGGLLRVDGKVIAFTIGEVLNDDTYVLHFEKAFADMQGAYPMINREFARHIAETYPQILYINREEDMGLESLQKAKRSYYPCHMVEKYTAIWKTDLL